MESTNNSTMFSGLMTSGLMTYALMENENIKHMALGYNEYSLAVNLELGGEKILWFVAFPKKESMHGTNKLPVLAVKICALIDLPEPILQIFAKQFIETNEESPNFDFFFEGMELRCTKEAPIAMIPHIVRSAQFIIKKYREAKEKGDTEGCYELLYQLMESLLSIERNEIPEEERKEIVRKHRIATGFYKE